MANEHYREHRFSEMKNKKTIVCGMLAVLLTCATAAGLFAQTEADFDVTLTEDGEGVVITQYTGSATVVKIPDTIQGMPVKEIGEKAFAFDPPYRRNETDRRITAVTLPAGLIKIGNYAFGRSKLTSVVIPSGVTEIANAIFDNCESLASVSLPDTVTRIGSSAFSGCAALRSITLPPNLAYLGSSAFSFSGLTSVTIPGTLGEWVEDNGYDEGEAIKNCFDGCSSLTTVIIGEGITQIGSQVFNKCKALTSVTLPSTIQKIGRQAFQDCSALTTITIPNSVEKIEFKDYVFDGCSKILLATQARLKKLGYTEKF
jgi:hypothetical protein